MEETKQKCQRQKSSMLFITMVDWQMKPLIKKEISMN